MRAETLNTTAALAALADEWWALWRSVPEATPFQAPAWLLAWWRHFAPGALAVVAVRDGGRLVGLAPLYREHGGGRLLPIGISLSDYHDVLIEPGRFEAVAEAVAAEAGRLDWPSWELPDLRDDAAAWRLPAPAGTRSSESEAAAGAVLELPAAIPPRQRRKHRMAVNRARRRGVLRFETGDARMLDALLRLHAARWTRRGEPGGVLADARVGAFLAEAVPAMHGAGLVRLYAVRIGDAVAGAWLGFSHRGRVYAYMGGFDPAFAHESPGTLLLGHAIAAAEAEGAREFDMLRGSEAYKFAWGAARRVSRCRRFERVAAHAGL